MASPKDPVDWTVDDVIQFFCREEAGEWSYNLPCPDLQALETALRENYISGIAFLRITYEMVKDLGVSAIGHRQYVLAARDSLQRLSPKFQSTQRPRPEAPSTPANSTALSDEPIEPPTARKTPRRLEPTLITQPTVSSHPEAALLDEYPASKPSFGQESFFDHLLKAYPANDNEAEDLVPLLGDSGSEGEYDSDTVQELEEDEVPGRPGASGLPESPENLTAQEFHAIIDQYIADHEGYFTTTRLPKEEHKAFALWTRGQNRPETINGSLRRYAHLKKRLRDLRKALGVAEHTSRSSLVKACACLDQTLTEMFLNRWQVSILKKEEPPSKVARPPRVPRVPRVAKLIKYSDGEETLSSDTNSVHDSDFLDDTTDEPGSEGEEDATMVDDESEVDAPEHRGEKDEVMADYDVEQSDGNRSVEFPYEIPLDKVPKGCQRSRSRGHISHGPFRDSSSSDEDLSHLRLQGERYNPPASKKRRLEAETSSTKKPEHTPDETVETAMKSNSETIEDVVKILETAQYMTWETIRNKGEGSWSLAKSLVNLSEYRILRLYDFTETFVDCVYRDLTQEALQAMSDQVSGLEDWKAEDRQSIRLLASLFVSWVNILRLPLKQMPPGAIKSALAVVGEVSMEDEVDEFSKFFKCLINLGKGFKSFITLSSHVQPDESDMNAEHPSTKRRRTAARDLTRAQKEAQDRQESQQTKRALLGSQICQRDDGLEDIRKAISFQEPIIYLDPSIGKDIKDHQLHGVQFMFREIIENRRPEGCLLAHTMGLGKTMQVISLLVTISAAGASQDPAIRDQIPEELRQCRTLILCPAALIRNWYKEFSRWLPRNHKIGKVRAIRPRTATTGFDRDEEIRVWNDEGGVLIISYDIFRRTVGTLVGNSGTQAHEMSILNVQNWLLDGPTLVVADEAQTIRNNHSLIAGAASRFRTRKRIALTGTPLSNGLKDYYSMLDWVAPRYLGTFARFNDKFIKVIEAGSHTESTVFERRNALRRQALLLRIISPKVDRADMSVLVDSLPPKYEFSFYIELTPFQKAVYNHFVDAVRAETAVGVGPQLWSWLNLLKLCCVHPAVFRAQLEMRESHGTPCGDHQSPSGDDSGPRLNSNVPTPEARRDDHQGHSSHKTGHRLGLTMPTAETIFPRSKLPGLDHLFSQVPDLKHPWLSSRVMILHEIVNNAISIGDKVLVFSSSIPTLDYLEAFFCRTRRKCCRLDGKVDSDGRLGVINNFNNDPVAHIFLISTHAGGIGLNIQAANRIVIFDFLFNPTWEEQAVGRAYRLGQKKKVYVYRMVAGGTIEEKIYGKTIFKKQLACRVIDNKNVTREGIARGPKQYLIPWEPSQHGGGIERAAYECDPEMMQRLQGSNCIPWILRVKLSGDEEDPNDRLTADEDRQIDEEWRATHLEMRSSL